MTLAEPRAATPVPTPCIGICQLDEASGLCLGCARTGEEIGAWQTADEGHKLRVWGALPGRRARIELATYRLPWSAEEIAAFIERSLRQRSGRWVFGLDGASISFAIAPEEDAEIVGGPDAVTAVTARGALRLAKHPKMIAVAFGALGDAGPEAIGLILPRGRVDLRRGDTLAGLGPDVAALATCGEALRYDLGVARNAAARFCLRTADPALIAALDGAEGRNWRDVLEEIGSLIDTAQPHYVVETGLGRAEFFAPAPAAGFPHEAGIGFPLPWGEGQGEGYWTIDGEDRASHGDLTPSPPPSPHGRGSFPRVLYATGAELRPDRTIFTELPAIWSLPAVFASCALFYPHVRGAAHPVPGGV